MSKINNEIRKIEAEMYELKNEIVDFTKLKTEYKVGLRDMNEDYPNWNHPFHRTPMDWIDFMIGSKSGQLELLRKRVNELVKEREWYECECCGYFRNEDLLRAISEDGFIIGIKL